VERHGRRLAAVHRIGYTDALPEVPAWLSAEAKDFLARCFRRRRWDRPTAEQLVAHPFVASAARDRKPERVKKTERPSPKTTLDDAFWDSDDDMPTTSPAERIGALATSALPDWDSDEGWIDLHGGEQCEAVDATRLATTEAAIVAAVPDYFVWAQLSDEDLELEQFATAADVPANAPDCFVQNRASAGESEPFTVIDDLPRVAGAVTDATLSQGCCFPECKIQRSCDHGGTEAVAVPQNVCNRNRVNKNETDFTPTSALFASTLHVRLATVQYQTLSLLKNSKIKSDSTWMTSYTVFVTSNTFAANGKPNLNFLFGINSAGPFAERTNAGTVPGKHVV
jgi:hypothetical protein